MRERLLMNRNWLFYFGEPDYKRPKPTSSDQTYRGSRAENARGPARRDFTDSDWKTVTLPHDFVNENGPSPDCLPGEKHGYPLDRGSAWYRRYFRLEETDRGKRITLLFDGVATRCEVYVNSMFFKLNRTAGIGFEVDITDAARFGTDYNLVSVHVDCHDYEAWYYEGGGIYRNVWLIKTDPLAVDLWGTFVRSKQLDGNQWQLGVETKVRNDYYSDKTAKVISRIDDPSGETVAELVCDTENFFAQAVTTVYQNVLLSDPALWSPEICNLYTLYTEIVLDGETVDDYQTTFGIRELRFDPDHGMFLNGKKTVIYGFANHQIQVGVGNAMSDSMREFQLRTIHDIGGNGFRTAHSPHGPATYDYCDRYGLMVMDENRIFQPSDTVKDEVRRLIKRDRNHPSVIMWSLYNEEDTVTHETGKRIYRRLACTARELDPTRPISGATSYGMFSEGAYEDYDLLGINHQTMNFPALHHAKPDKPLYSSEMVIPLGKARNFLGPDIVPGQDAHSTELEYAIGGYHFTAWAFGSDRGRIFACDGTPRTIAHGFRAYLKQDEPFVKICPGWNHPEKEGQKVELNIANNGDYVELFVNGTSRGTVKTDLYTITPFTTLYEPGEIQAIAYKDGKRWAEDTARTSGEPVAIKLVMENPSLKDDNDDVAIISAYLVDDGGNWCDTETGYPVHWDCNCAGEYVSSVSIRNDGYMGWHGPDTTFFEGKVQAFFRSLAVDQDLVITAETEGLPKAELVIRRDKVGAIPAVTEVPNNFILDWRISKLYPYTMDDEQVMKERQIELWEHIDTQGSPDILYGALPGRTGPGLYPAGTSMNYAYYSCTMIPDMGNKGGKKLALFFEGLDGIANIVVTDGTKTAQGHHPANSPWPGHYRPEMVVDCDQFKPGDQVEIWVFIHDAVRITGIGWPVRWAFMTQQEIDEVAEKERREWALHTYKG